MSEERGLSASLEITPRKDCRGFSGIPGLSELPAAAHQGAVALPLTPSLYLGVTPWAQLGQPGSVLLPAAAKEHSFLSELTQWNSL